LAYDKDKIVCGRLDVETCTFFFELHSAMKGNKDKEEDRTCMVSAKLEFFYQLSSWCP